MPDINENTSHNPKSGGKYEDKQKMEYQVTVSKTYTHYHFKHKRTLQGSDSISRPIIN